jgi:hypothetical protein
VDVRTCEVDRLVAAEQTGDRGDVLLEDREAVPHRPERVSEPVELALVPSGA